MTLEGQPTEWCVAVVGSRSIKDLCSITTTLEVLHDNYGDRLVLVSGGATGVDTAVEEWAWENEVRCEVIKPDYSTYGRRAPLERNKLIADRCNAMVALWDGKSTGTMHAVACAKERGKPVEVFQRA